MKQLKDVNAVIAKLQALIARDDVDSNQKRHVEGALNSLRRLRRNPHADQAVVFACVREVAERLLEAFQK